MENRLGENTLKSAASGDFIVRRNRALFLQVFGIFALAFSILYYTAVNMEAMGGQAVFILALFVVIGLLAWFTVYFALRNRDMVMVAEFQNTLFASAAGLSMRFTLIIKEDGTIVYFDPGFQKIFPKFLSSDIRSLSLLFETEGISTDITRKIYGAMDSGNNERFIMELRSPDGAPVKTFVTLDRLPRPRGFWVLRGREYVDPRQVGAMDRQQPGDSMPTLLTGMLHSLPLGIYVTDPKGHVLFANRVLEHWLGFDELELQHERKAISTFIYQMNDGRPSALGQSPFDGDAQLRRKNGSLIKMFVSQQAIIDGSGGIIGGAGMVYEAGKTEDVKKNILSH